MPGAGFKTFTAGEVFTATDANTYLMQQAVMVFTNEAARDAAITAPSEGMHAYLTTPTVPAATGATTAVPTGVRTIYNGTNWVCVTPVGALSTTSATTTSATYGTTLTGDSTAVSVTLVTGTTARIDMTAVGSISQVANLYVTFSVSGATTVAASDTNSSFAAVAANTYTVSLHRSAIITGLTAGTNTFTLNYRLQGGGTATYVSRNLIVTGVA